MEGPLLAMGATARAWDEQHLDLQAAAGKLTDAPTDGFTGAVAGTAERFAGAWGRHTTDLADVAEARADGLRATASDFARTDGSAADRSWVVQASLREVR